MTATLPAGTTDIQVDAFANQLAIGAWGFKAFVIKGRQLGAVDFKFVTGKLR